MNYRKLLFLNRKRAEGWLPPSLISRVFNIETWVKRLIKYCPITAISQELVRFDTQLIQNPEISGVQYQQGELAGYEVREYLLEKWARKCTYCGATDIQLEVEHIKPKSKGGSNRVSNLTLSCRPCNQLKSNQDIKDFLSGQSDLLKRIQAQAKKPLADTAAVNATRWKLKKILELTGLPMEVGSGGLTKYNRCRQNLEKSHWLDASCVGKSTPEKLIIKVARPLIITATGHGFRQRIIPDKYGFARGHRPRIKQFFGFQTGDLVVANVLSWQKSRPSLRSSSLSQNWQF